MQKLLLLAATAWASLGAAAAQSAGPLPFERRPAPPVVCPARPENMNTFRGAPAAFLNPALRRGQAGPADITVTYTGFTPQAQAAFQQAVDIWKALLSSPVPIHVQAQWTKLGQGVLGSAGATDVVRNFPGALQANVWYPIALAEKIAGQELNGPADAEIAASFSSAANWYYGLDGKTPAGKYDLVSVVLHELCHGLGFVAGTTYDETGATGGYGFPAVQGGPSLPYTFATFIENAAGQRLTNAQLFKNPSAGLGTEYTSGGLYFNSPLAAAVNPAPGDKRPKLYAPTPYSNGSSVSHMDEVTYRAGDPNSLMTYAIGAQEAIHDPGPLVRKMFDEMGWFSTSIRHTPLKDTETPQNFPITATVLSDGTVTPGSVKLTYAVGSGAILTLPMVATGVANQYRATIPNPGTGVIVRYFISAADNETGRTYSAPGVAAPGITTRPTYSFNVGPDTTPPQVAHTPPPYLFANKLPYPLVVQADDNLGVASVSVPYSVNGTARPPLTLSRQANGITYLGTLSTAAGPIVAGDVVSYSVVATDQAAQANKTTLGPFTVPIVGLKAAQDQYVNDFNAPTNDFVGVGFKVAQPTGFLDPAIHSDHPYADQTNLTYQLLVPIKVRSAPASDTVKFNEIVLAEPGDDDAAFGTPNFYDYVVVEGSLDGETWTPLADGYDAAANPKWLQTYNGAISNNNSTAVGTPALFAKHTFNLRNRFAAGAVVQLRFRLFADEAAHGWGWAVDNLSIQRVSLADKLTPGDLNVFPNPTSTGQVQVIARLARPTSGLELQVVDVLGRQVSRRGLLGAASQVDQPLDVTGLRPGMYFVRLLTGDEIITRRFVIQSQ